MKKRIAMALSMLMVVLMLGACGTDPTTVDYNGYSYYDLLTEMETSCSIAQSLAGFFEQYGITEENLTESDRESLLAANDGLTEEQLDSGLRWLAVTDEVGAFVGADEDSFSVEKSGKTLTTNLRLQFEERDVDFQVVYTYYNMKISGVTMEPVYSMSEKLAKAGMNTLISILIVFAVLILISLIIACFNIFPYLEKRKAEKAGNTSQQEDAESAESQLEAREARKERPEDDTELVAVIAAAIAADTGTQTSDFVVRSINRRK